jgi:hypothetical protein
MVAAAGSGTAMEVRGAGTGVAGIVGEADESAAQAVTAGPSDDDTAASAGHIGDRAGAALGGKLFQSLEAVADISEVRKGPSCAEAAGARIECAEPHWRTTVWPVRSSRHLPCGGPYADRPAASNAGRHSIGLADVTPLRGSAFARPKVLQ